MSNQLNPFNAVDESEVFQNIYARLLKLLKTQKLERIFFDI